jgi:L-fuconolactonase
LKTTRRRLLRAAGLGGLGLGMVSTLNLLAPAVSSKRQSMPGAVKAEVDSEPAEPILDPELPIVDPHHHLWYLPQIEPAKRDESIWSAMVRRHAHYMLQEFLADVNTGHNIRATVYLEASTMYRNTGSNEMKSVGEVEFANGVAAMAASGLFGSVKVCAGIVGYADLGLGEAAQDVLEAHVRAGNGRYRGVRYNAPDLFGDRKFRDGFRCLHELGLSFDTFIEHSKLPELIDLARSFPETTIILNHVGGPVGMCGDQRNANFATWRDSIRTIAKCENVVVKLGGLGSTDLPGFKTYGANPPATSGQLAAEWKPFIDTCAEAFGVDRCMFESDFPPGSSSCTYPILWNTFKRLSASASHDEKAALFSGTAMRVYRISM